MRLLVAVLCGLWSVLVYGEAGRMCEQRWEPRPALRTPDQGAIAWDREPAPVL